MPHRATPCPHTLGLAAAAVLCSCAASPDAAPHHADLHRLAAAMTGTFDSSAHAARDDAFFDIRLVMVPIWDDRADGPWLYVEQAVSASAERPYRQRVYRLVDLGHGALRSDVYTLPGEPLDFAGAWATGALDDVTPEQLQERTGCSISLRVLPDGTFTGSTDGDGCASTLRGAAYATSEVTIAPEVLVSWDRGWDADGQQVWGAVTGGYEFVKLSGTAPAE